MTIYELAFDSRNMQVLHLAMYLVSQCGSFLLMDNIREVGRH